MDNTKTYDEALEAILDKIKSYGQQGELLGYDNLNELRLHKNFDIEPEDIESHIKDGSRIIITSDWQLPIGNQVFNVKGLFNDTDYQWNNWKLILISQKGVWQSLDSRLI